MKEYQSADIRNFAIVGHGSTGKTLLSESILASSGVINRLGTIEGKNTASDYHEDEQEHQISVHSSLLHTEWEGKKFNIIDTPGYSDFISEALGALRVVDSCLVVLDSENGIEVGTEQVWSYATQYKIPKILVLNKCNKEHADFDAVLAQAKERFGSHVCPMNIPIHLGPDCYQLLDVISKKVITYSTDGTGQYEEKDADGELKDKVEKLHGELIEEVAESDDKLLEKFFEKGCLTEEEMQAGIHAAIQSESVIPLFCTSGNTNVGVTHLMNFIAKYGASPLDKEKVMALRTDGSEVEVKLTDADPVGFIFKTLSESHVGGLSFFRIYSGKVETGMDLYNSTRKHTERIGQMFSLNGKNRESVKIFHAGDIGAMVKLRNTHTNDTLCHSKNPLELEKVKYPEPNIHAALKPNSKGEEDKVAMGLSTLHEEDPTFIYHIDPELKQTVISGQGELHLKIISESIKRRFSIELQLVEPRIPYRETIKGKGDSKYRHKKQSGGAGQFAEVWMRVEPRMRGEGVEFTQSLVGQNVDRVFVPSVEKGVMMSCQEGPLAGYRVVDVKVDFYDGKQHPVDSKDIAFQIAGQKAFNEAFVAARPCILEPICYIEVKVPDHCMGDIIGDISSRRGKVLGVDADGGFQIIRAHVPQAELYRYSTAVRSLTAGRGIHKERLDHYEELPPALEKKVVESSQRQDSGEAA